MIRAVIYARFSSDRQREESIEGQVRECMAYAARKDYSVGEVYADRALSGTNDKRPEFQRMIADAKRGAFQVVICWKHDRFARNRYDASLYRVALRQHKVAIEYAAETTPEGPEGIIFDSIMEGYAEYYSANLSQNVKRGMYDSALKRMTLGQTCFGLRRGKDGRFEVDPVDGPIVRRVFEEYVAGKSSKEITDALAAEGVRQFHGAEPGKNFVPNIIKNPKYKGVYQYADIYDENGIPAIVDPDLWARANELLAERYRAPASKRKNGEGYILSGKLFCGHCANSMTAYTGTGRHGKKYQYYACNGRREKKNGCQKKIVDKQWIEDLVVRALVEIVHSDAVIDMFADRFQSWQMEEAKKSGIPALEDELADLDRRIDNLAESLADLKAPVARQKLAGMEEARAALSARIENLKIETPLLVPDAVRWFLERFRDGDADDPRWRAYLVNTFLQKAYVFDDGRLLLQLNYSGDKNAFGIEPGELEAAILNCPAEDRQTVPMRNAEIAVAFVGPFLLAAYGTK